MNLRGVRCVVLDLDDTLYLERDYVRSGFRTVARWVEENRGLKGFYETVWGLFEEGRRGRIFDEALVALGDPAAPSTVAEMVTVYRRHAPAIECLPDSREFMARSAARGVALACLSDGPLESQEAKVRALGVERYCSPVILTARYGPGFGKPHARGFVEIEERRGARGAECAYIGDNPAKDLAAPRALGWRTVRVRRPGSLHEGVPSGGDVDVECTDMRGLGL